MQLSFTEPASYGAILLHRNPCGQHVVTGFRQPRKDLGKLLRTFSRPEDYLRHAHAQGPMMVHIGEAEVLERKML